MTVAYVALGANLGDPVASVRTAISLLGELPASRLLRVSSLYRTAPVGLAHQPDFINAVAALDTALAARPLLEALFALEERFGRRRSVANAPRTLDLDLLLHGATRLATPTLTLPHPRMHQRAFVLAPLAEIAADLVIPGHPPLAELLAACRAQGIQRLD